MMRSTRSAGNDMTMTGVLSASNPGSANFVHAAS
jgi:hypothetical protein